MLAGCSGSSHATLLPSGSLHASDAATAAVPASGTIYVADTDRVYALPIGASGPVAAQRTIVPHPDQTQQTLDGLATAPDGTLYILEHRSKTAGRTTTVRCRVVAESATADGSPAALSTTACDPTDQAQGFGIARNTLGGYDVLYQDLQSNALAVRRFANGGASVGSTLVLNAASGDGLATDFGGHDYVDTAAGEILKYKASVTDATVRAEDVQVAGSPSNLRAIAVSPADFTVYVVEGDPGNETIAAIPPGSSTPARTIGPFTMHSVSALAVDAQGNVYVAVNPNGGSYPYSTIRVYGPNAQGAADAADRIIIPAEPTTLVRGIAVAG